MNSPAPIGMRHDNSRCGCFLTLIVALVSVLANTPVARAQVCPSTFCTNRPVQEACTVTERIFDPFGIAKSITKQSVCTVTKRFCEPVLAQCTDLTSRLPSISSACHATVEASRSIERTANEARKQVWAQINTSVRNSGINVAQDVTLYDLDGKASFTYNAYAGSAWYEVTLPKGLKIEEGKVKSSLDGNFSIPNVDPKTVISEFGFVKTKVTNPYDSWAAGKKARQDEYVYVSSKRFVDTVSVENAAQDVAWAIVTGGQTAKGSIAAFEELLMLEWGDILSWLREVGTENSDEVAAEMAKAILDNGRKAALIPLKLGSAAKRLDVRIDVDVINYEYEMTPTISGEMRKILSIIGLESDKALAGLGSKVPVQHLAFSISIKGRKTQQPSHMQQISSFIDLLQRGPALDIGSLADKASGVIGVDLGKARRFKDVDGRGSIRQGFVQAFSDVLAEAERHHRGGGVFDFTNSRFAKELEKKLSGLTFGNSKDPPKVTKLVVDAASASVSLDVDLHSRHRLLRVDILRELEKAWIANDQAESKLFNEALHTAKAACDKLAEACRSLSQWGVTPQACSNATGYQELALEPLSRPLDTTLEDNPSHLHSTALRFSPDGKSLAVRWEGIGAPISAAEQPEQIVQVISVADGQSKATFQTGAYCRHVAWNDTSSAIAYVSKSRLTARTILNGKMVTHNVTIKPCEWAPFILSQGLVESSDAGHVAVSSVGWHAPLRIYKLGSHDGLSLSKELMRVTQTGLGVESVSFSSNGERLAVTIPVTQEKSVVRVYNTTDKAAIFEKVLEHGLTLTRTLLSGNGKRLVNISAKMRKDEHAPFVDQVDVFDVSTRAKLGTFELKHNGTNFKSSPQGYKVALNNEGSLLAHKAEGGFVELTSLPNGDSQSIDLKGVSAIVEYNPTLAFSVNGKFLAAAWPGGGIYIIDVKNKEVLRVINGEDTLRGIELPFAVKQ